MSKPPAAGTRLEIWMARKAISVKTQSSRPLAIAVIGGLFVSIVLSLIALGAGSQML